MVGGGAKNIQWAKILSSLLNVQIVDPENQDFVASVGAVRLAIKRLTKNKHKFKSLYAKPVEVESLLREVLLERFDQYLIHQHAHQTGELWLLASLTPAIILWLLL